MPSIDDPYVRIGVLNRPFGLAGAIRCALDTDAAPVIATPCDGMVGYSLSFAKPIRLERCEPRPHELICYFVGVADRVASEALADYALFVRASMVSYGNNLADPGLVGFEVRDEDGNVLGVIEAIFGTQAHFIWQVRSERGEHLVPAIDPFVRGIQPAERVAIVRPIPGMFDDDADTDDSGR